MTLDKFIKKYTGKTCKHPQGIAGQCVCLYRCYLDEVLSVPQSPSVSGARLIWNTYSKDHFDRIPKSLFVAPQKGDIVIFDKFPGNPHGHVSICISAGVFSFTSFDSNWSVPKKAKIELHSYKYVIGWLRKKTNETLASKINMHFRNTFKREPEKEDNDYFLSRIGSDIKTEEQLIEKMKYWSAQSLAKWRKERKKVLGK